jgi:hypothetical protein
VVALEEVLWWFGPCHLYGRSGADWCYRFYIFAEYWYLLVGEVTMRGRGRGRGDMASKRYGVVAHGWMKQMGFWCWNGSLDVFGWKLILGRPICWVSVWWGNRAQPVESRTQTGTGKW